MRVVMLASMIEFGEARRVLLVFFFSSVPVKGRYVAGALHDGRIGILRLVQKP